MSRPSAYSIGRQLSLRLVLLTVGILSLLCVAIYAATWALYERSHQRILTLKINKLTETSQSLLRRGDDRFLDLLRGNAQRRPGTRLELFHADGSMFYRDPPEEPHVLSAHRVSRDFQLPYPDGVGHLGGTFAVDIENDVHLLRSLAVVLVLATIVGGLAAGAFALMAARDGLRPVRAITRQTEQLSAQRLGRRLALQRPALELQPWVDQFNGLMDRMERSYAQLEAFNADVAHELRTPLTSLIGKTELALTRQRSADELSETLASNLEELHRMAGLVNDMLFLSRADRGTRARLGPAMDLRDLVRQVLEFHEAAAAERQLKLEVAGGAHAPVDEGLFKRAVSNLVGNATRYADAGSTLRVLLAQEDAAVTVEVENSGPTIAAGALPLLFDRFYRADASRQDSGAHHGLGLAIVAGIARMHGGQTFARSSDRCTRIGFSVALPDALPAPQPVQEQPVQEASPAGAWSLDTRPRLES